ncbi:exo-beta-N-acetylmuramidase NamZ family protein [Desulfomonile tiedjei]|uniref:DUF1343 domain-containing protein n=1 Tax=Desulfomonile tiedjei (strain ATCC 49306 / DSM 6799 / DCB-1) TaxID=706587 RepID=I4C2N7_DESTA|nr:DUF1343 domain-containing protein [Desulfomonile tiedjei]AFM23828.1 hypothetical protein Desti_1114 [Desulfomonile tiedjei DSM 6799]
MVITGLERILREPQVLSRAGRLGLLYNYASVNTRFESSADLIAARFPGRLRTLFGPQHGVGGTEQDNMRETGHGMHPYLNIPVYSLYSETRIPRPDMLESVDTVLVDIQDVGTRVYTFATTVLNLMHACAETGKAVFILDRPNPIDGKDVEGNILNPAFASFVGPFPIPMRHGMTLGELMALYHAELDIGCELEIITLGGWNPNTYFEDTGLPWILPSPNMPLVETAVVYPGQVILEGTNLSEGRGTTRPFEIWGAPFIEPGHVTNLLEKNCITGAVLRETDFKPTFNKWAGQHCRGYQIHVTDRELFRPFRATLAFISALLKLYPEEFRWSEPPYEYVSDKLPVDVILGDDRLRLDLEQGRSIEDLEHSWSEDLDKFLSLRSRFLLYPR